MYNTEVYRIENIGWIIYWVYSYKYMCVYIWGSLGMYVYILAGDGVDVFRDKHVCVYV